MDPGVIIITACVYIACLFLIAFWTNRRANKGQSLVNNPLIYSLSLAVYCTAWTFFGSVGRAATQGIGFLPIYLGPTILAPVWILMLKKIIIISKSQRITSIADFISSRYGKSTTLGLLATIIAVVGITPYISIQLKAISFSFNILSTHSLTAVIPGEVPFYLDSSLYIAIALAAFAILFGTRNIDPNERHEGLIAAIAFESLVKLIAFLAVGLFVTFGIFNGWSDLFSQASNFPEIEKLFSFEANQLQSQDWFWLILLSMSAILFLPRQFHVAVVENNSSKHVAHSAWLFPLYLFLINIFVLPIAIGGLISFSDGSVEPDTFVLTLPLLYGQEALAILAGLGGFSAAASMVIVSVLALSIMISNNLVLPYILKSPALQEDQSSLTKPLLGIRRVSIIIVLLIAYGYFKLVAESYSLVSIGLISFTAVAQFAPAVLGGIYWKRATKSGAIAGLVAGFIIWFYTLPIPTLAEANIIPNDFIENGPWGIYLLKPYALFGLEGSSHITNAAFWSLLFNLSLYVLVSLNTRPSTLEIAQADIFVDIYKYRSGSSDYEVVKRKAKVADLQNLLIRFLGKGRAEYLFQRYEHMAKVDLSKLKTANAELVNYTETNLAGAIGAAAAKVVIGSISSTEPISLQEMFKILDQTQEIIQYSKALERQSKELQKTTRKLKQANEQLQELDRLKADFITTVTHELRTPITSIKALSKIMADNPDLAKAEKEEFLQILVNESERVARLINQVLDLEKIQSSNDSDWKWETFDLQETFQRAFRGVKPLIDEKGIQTQIETPDHALMMKGDEDRITQVIVNLLSNALKFCNQNDGKIDISIRPNNNKVLLAVKDNGKGISKKNQQLIFDKFTQVNDQKRGKPKGSGLGLFISKTIIERHQGRLLVESTPNEGATFIIELPLI